MRFKTTILAICMLLSVGYIQAQDANRPAYTAEAKVYDNKSLNPTNQIEVYPNPSIDYVIVNIKNSDLKSPTFEMHSVIGNSVDLVMEQLGRDRYKIDLGDFASGYYFLVVKDEQTQFRRAFKFLKK